MSKCASLHCGEAFSLDVPYFTELKFHEYILICDFIEFSWVHVPLLNLIKNFEYIYMN